MHSLYIEGYADQFSYTAGEQLGFHNWGGHSLYSYHDRDGIQGHRVSFERPPLARFFRTWELPFVEWAELDFWRITRNVLRRLSL